MQVIRDLFTLTGLLAFLLGVLLATWVKSATSKITSKAGA